MALTLTSRSVGMVVAAALATGWLGASLTQDRAPAQAPRSSGSRPLGVQAPMPRAEHLRQRLSEPPQPGRGRNPFVFGARPPVRTSGFRNRGSAPPETPAIPIYEPVARALPVFKLSGIASNAEGGATVLTAILSDNGSLVFAKAGDRLSNGYSVVRVDETSVTLADGAGVTQTIKLP